LRKKVGRGGGGDYFVFAGVFEGVLEKVVRSGWFFCGEVVVNCVVDVVSGMGVF
jgi:hypothetical protein